MQPSEKRKKTCSKFVYTWRRDYAPNPESHLVFFPPLSWKSSSGSQRRRHPLLSLHARATFSLRWSPAAYEEISHRGGATSGKHVICMWPLLIEDVSAVEWGTDTGGVLTRTHAQPFSNHTQRVHSSQLFTRWTTRDDMMGNGPPRHWKAPEEKPKGWTEGPPWWMYICIKGLKHICLFQTVVIKMILIWKCINVASLKKALDERTHFMQVWTHLHLSDTDSHTAPLRSLYEYLKRDGWTQ